MMIATIHIGGIREASWPRVVAFEKPSRIGFPVIIRLQLSSVLYIPQGQFSRRLCCDRSLGFTHIEQKPKLQERITTGFKEPRIFAAATNDSKDSLNGIVLCKCMEVDSRTCIRDARL